MYKTLLVAALLTLTACGGGGGSDPADVAMPPVIVDLPPVVVVPPVVEPEPPVVVELVQMSKPEECDTVPSATGDPLRPYITCDGVPIKEHMNYPYDPESTEIAYIEVLAVVDTKLTDEERDGLTPEEFVQREFDYANKVFADSGVYISLQLSGIMMVEVGVGDLLRQYRVFTAGSREFRGVIQRETETRSDYSFLFKQREAEPFACGVASLDMGRVYARYRRGIAQCFQNSVFNETTTTRYYERAGVTFVHEMGHLLGLEHNVESATTDPAFAFSYGYLLPEFENKLSDEFNGYGTIMSYSDKPTGRFSDPTQYFTIPETGQSVPLGNGTTNAVEHLNRVRYYYSQLFETMVGE